MKKIAIVRPEDKLKDASKIAKKHGLEPVCAPMIEVVGTKDENFDKFLQNLRDGQVEYIIFTSTNGIKFSLENTTDKDEFINVLNRSKIVAIGDPTKKYLEERGINVFIVPDKFSSDGIVAKLSNYDLKQKMIWVLRSSHGSGILIDGLKNLGAEVFETQVYSIELPKDLSRQKNLVKSAVEGDIDIFTFTSRMTVVNFLKIADDLGLKSDVICEMNKKVVLAIGDPTKEELEKSGIKVEDVPGKYTFEALIKNKLQKV